MGDAGVRQDNYYNILEFEDVQPLHGTRVFENAAQQEIAGTENPAIFGCWKKWLHKLFIEFDVLFSSLSKHWLEPQNCLTGQDHLQILLVIFNKF